MSKEKQIIEQLEKDIRLNLAVTPNPKEERTHQVARLLVKDGWRKQNEGKWIEEADGYADGELVYDVWKCSQCNHYIDDGTDDADLLPNYCPNCGAKMKGGE